MIDVKAPFALFDLNSPILNFPSAKHTIINTWRSFSPLCSTRLVRHAGGLKENSGTTRLSKQTAGSTKKRELTSNKQQQCQHRGTRSLPSPLAVVVDDDWDQWISWSRVKFHDMHLVMLVHTQQNIPTANWDQRERERKKKKTMTTRGIFLLVRVDWPIGKKLSSPLIISARKREREREEEKEKKNSCSFAHTYTCYNMSFVSALA